MAENTMQPRSLGSIREKLTASMTAHADKTALLCKNGEGFHPYTYRRLRSDIEALGTALLCEGVSGGNILILGKGGYEWTLSILAVLFGVGIAIPLDSTLSGTELDRLIEISEPSAILYDDSIFSEDAFCAVSKKFAFSTLNALLEKGRNQINSGNRDFFKCAPTPDAPALIAFAATAKPKGVILSGANLCAALDALYESLTPGVSDRYLSTLPPHHVYELVCGLLLPLSCGASVAYGGGMRTLLADMKEARPSSLVAIPAIVEALARRVRARLGSENNSLSALGVRAATLLPPTAALSIKKKLFTELHELFGGKLSRVICAGAPVDCEHLKLLSGIGLSVTEGYSIAECAGMAALNTPAETRIGTAGKKLAGVTADIYNMQEDGRGEIRLKSRSVMLGYYKDTALSDEVLRDGWLYTGDIGSLDKDGYLQIVGRKRNMMVTAGGKSIFPEELEQLLCRSPFIREAVVVGFVNPKKRDYDLVAVVRPDTAALEAVYGEDYTLSDTNTEIENAMETLTKDLPSYKRPMMFVLRHTPFERNSARKLRRSGVAASVEQAYRNRLSEK